MYTHERLPQGPRWSEVQQLLDANRGDAAVQIRNYAMLLLLAVYGFRSGEVCCLTLDDIDWEQERIHPPRPKQRKVGQYPLVGEVADAIVRYLTRVRPRCASRAVFVTLRRPYRPLSGGGLSTQVRVAQRRLGQTLQRYGPHGLRHANATYQLFGPSVNGPHGTVHIWVGGQMSHFCSPADPVFWMHHAMLDHLWCKWQKTHPLAVQYVPDTNDPGLNTAMAPWNTGVGDVKPAVLHRAPGWSAHLVTWGAPTWPPTPPNARSTPA